jgi:molybdopterin synthase catalytic subunit
MKQHTPKNIFITGPITPEFISVSIRKHSTQQHIGAHSIFLGQVRNDLIQGSPVEYIEYSCYEDMVLPLMHTIREEMFSTYELTCMHVYHSLGKVSAGEISLFVFTSSVHRAQAIAACTELVERIKKELPIWGKEVTTEQVSQWKKNAE